MTKADILKDLTYLVDVLEKIIKSNDEMTLLTKEQDQQIIHHLNQIKSRYAKPTKGEFDKFCRRVLP